MLGFTGPRATHWAAERWELPCRRREGAGEGERHLGMSWYSTAEPVFNSARAPPRPALLTPYLDFLAVLRVCTPALDHQHPRGAHHSDHHRPLMTKRMRAAFEASEKETKACRGLTSTKVTRRYYSDTKEEHSGKAS